MEIGDEVKYKSAPNENPIYETGIIIKIYRGFCAVRFLEKEFYAMNHKLEIIHDTSALHDWLNEI